MNTPEQIASRFDVWVDGYRRKLNQIEEAISENNSKADLYRYGLAYEYWKNALDQAIEMRNDILGQ